GPAWSSRTPTGAPAGPASRAVGRGTRAPLVLPVVDAPRRSGREGRHTGPPLLPDVPIGTRRRHRRAVLDSITSGGEPVHHRHGTTPDQYADQYDGECQ